MNLNVQRWLSLLFSGVLPVYLACSSSSSSRGSTPETIASSQSVETGEAPSQDINPTETTELGSFGIDLSTQDLNVKPGDDFHEFASGAWLKSYKLKPDETSFGSYRKLSDRSEEQVKAIFEEVSNGDFEPGSIEQQLGDYFASFMAVDTLNEKGITPLEDDLNAIDQIADPGELVDFFGQSWRSVTISPIAVLVGVDFQDSDRSILNIRHSGLRLPSREYYLEDTENFKKIRDAYETNIAKMLSFTGLSAPESEAAAEKVLALETSIAEHHWLPAELRDFDKTNNPLKLAELAKRYPDYPWQRHFKAAEIDTEGLDQVNIVTPSAIRPLAKLIKTVPLATWKSYLKYHLITNHSPFLSEAIYETAFEFVGKVLNGQSVPRERWRRAVDYIADWRQSNLSQAMGQLYVERHFSPNAKEKMEKLVDNLREALRQRITALSWMGDETKRAALTKLDNFNVKIGYPDHWRDYSSIQISRDDLVGNFRAINAYWHQEELDDLRRPTNKDEWFMPPQTINAYYAPQYNEVVFPAGILQPPFFDLNADPAVNYGAIGAVIGHEIGHGFDDQGSKFDEAGVQRNWWADEDRERFEERAQALVAQYNAYEPIEGEHVNGQLTLGENIGDLGGLSMAYHAYKLSLGGKEAPVIDGLTGDQRFFLAWAQVWRGKSSDEATLIQLKSDPHSPLRFRVNGAVRNMDEWYEAFNVQEGDALYLPPEERVAIW